MWRLVEPSLKQNHVPQPSPCRCLLATSAIVPAGHGASRNRLEGPNKHHTDGTVRTRALACSSSSFFTRRVMYAAFSSIKVCSEANFACAGSKGRQHNPAVRSED